MFKNTMHNELRDMYTLFSKGESNIKYICKEMKIYIEEWGKSLININELEKDAVKFIKSIMKLKMEIDEIIINSFQNDEMFIYVSNLSFQNLMNQSQ